MRFLIDANLPRSIIELIVRLGHEAEFARDIGLGAAPDRAIAAHAQATQAALLTRDLDFADVRNYPPEQYSGIVVPRRDDCRQALGQRSYIARWLNDREQRPCTHEQQQWLASNHDAVDVPIAKSRIGCARAPSRLRKQTQHLLSCT